jgi:hypothetical protein
VTLRVATFITPGPVQLVGAGLLVTGVLLLAFGHRSERFSAVFVGAGALFATTGAVTGFEAVAARTEDGPTGWVSVQDIYSSMFASWPYVFVVALCAAGLWMVVERLFSHHWSAWSILGVAVGSLVGSMTLGLLDSSI